MQKTQRKKKERPKQKIKIKMGILYSYIVNDVVDEMKLSIHPSVTSSILSSVPSSIQTQQIYILKRDLSPVKQPTAHGITLVMLRLLRQVDIFFLSIWDILPTFEFCVDSCWVMNKNFAAFYVVNITYVSMKKLQVYTLNP